MKTEISRYKGGDFNLAEVEILPDGSQRFTLSKEGDDHLYRFRVKDLYGKQEKVLEHETIPKGKRE